VRLVISYIVPSREENLHFVSREDHRRVRGLLGALHVVDPRQLNAEDFAIHEENGVQRLVLSGCRDFAANCEVAEEGAECVRTELGGWMTTMEEDVSTDPLDVRLLRSNAVVLEADGFAYAVQEACRRGEGMLDIFPFEIGASRTAGCLTSYSGTE
jgi:hypothetical protein